MRHAIIPSLAFVALASAATAQKLTLQPQLGIENYKTSIKADGSCFSPLGAQVFPQLGARLDYRFKSGHGPYVGMSLNRSTVEYSFSDADISGSKYQASSGNARMRLDGGYMFTTKPIYFNKARSSSNTVKSYSRSGCSQYKMYSSSSGRCGRATETVKTNAKSSGSKQKGSYIRIQPSLGVAYVPFTDASLSPAQMGSQAGYTYLAGNWKLALATGVGFEFGKNDQRKLAVNINYLRGLTNMGRQSIVSTTQNKTQISEIRSSLSSWGLSFGVPISIGKTKQSVKQSQQVKEVVEYKKIEPKKTSTENKCGQYKSRCSRSIRVI